jgi:hypothetical protein
MFPKINQRYAETKLTKSRPRRDFGLRFWEIQEKGVNLLQVTCADERFWGLVC